MSKKYKKIIITFFISLLLMLLTSTVLEFVPLILNKLDFLFFGELFSVVKMILFIILNILFLIIMSPFILSFVFVEIICFYSSSYNNFIQYISSFCLCFLFIYFIIYLVIKSKRKKGETNRIKKYIKNFIILIVGIVCLILNIFSIFDYEDFHKIYFSTRIHYPEEDSIFTSRDIWDALGWEKLYMVGDDFLVSHQELRKNKEVEYNRDVMHIFVNGRISSFSLNISYYNLCQMSPCSRVPSDSVTVKLFDKNKKEVFKDSGKLNYIINRSNNNLDQVYLLKLKWHYLKQDYKKIIVHWLSSEEFEIIKKQEENFISRQ